MKKSTRAGLILALGLTMSSSFIVWDQGSETELPFGLPSALASASGTPGTSGVVSTGQVTLRDAALQERRMQALVLRVRAHLAAPQR